MAARRRTMHTAIQSIGISISLKIFEYLRTIRAGLPGARIEGLN